MLIGGEKWACEACVRGHRVSNCQHSDRPLQHINKKGRPVSQCQHCRTLRKSRSAHVRCECGSEKMHNKEAGIIGAIQADNCLCIYGVRCTCALKKEIMDPVLESDPDEPPTSEKRRARAHTRSPKNGLTIFTNGYHKLAHKHNKTAQKYGSPYPLPKSKSVCGPSPSGRVSRTKTDQGCVTKTKNSNFITKETSTGVQAKQNLPVSNCTSSDLSPTLDEEFLGAHIPTLSLFASRDMNWPPSLDSRSFTPDTENPICSAGHNSTSIDWSHYEGLNFNSEKLNTGLYSEPLSYTRFDLVSLDQPILTSTPTSGDLSEIDDLGPFSDRTSRESPFHHQNIVSDLDASDFSGDKEGYRTSDTSSLMHLRQAQILRSNSHMDVLDAFLKYSNTLSNHSHSLTSCADSRKKPGQELSPFLDDNFGLFSAEDESENFWISTFSPNCTTSSASSTQNGLLDNFWVQ